MKVLYKLIKFINIYYIMVHYIELVLRVKLEMQIFQFEFYKVLTNFF